MTKEEAIKVLEAEKKFLFHGSLSDKHYEPAFDMAIEALKAQQWIPCSERLPIAQTEVNVSCTDDSGDTKFRYTSSGWVTTDKEYWIVDNEINNFVVAWMPLPPAWKGE